MADPTYTLLKDGDSFDAASLNNRFSAVESAVNALDPRLIELDSVRPEHGNSVRAGGATLFFDPSSAVLYEEGTHSAYTWPSFGVVNSAGGAGGGTDLEVQVYSAAGAVPAYPVLLLAEIQVSQITDDGSPPTTEFGRYVALAFEVAGPLRIWSRIDRSIRFVGEASLSSAQLVNAPLRCLALPSDTAGGEIQYARVVLSVYDSVGNANKTRVYVKRCNLTGIMLKSTGP